MSSAIPTCVRLFTGASSSGLGLAIAFLMYGMVALLFATQAIAGQGTDITKVGEYWELDLNAPNTFDSAPQLTFLISPVGTADSLYAVFVVNQRDGAVGGL